MLGRRGHFEGVAFRNAESGHWPALHLAYLYIDLWHRPIAQFVNKHVPTANIVEMK